MHAQSGGVTVSSSSSTEDGTIRYQSGDFEGLKAGVWTTLTGAGGGSSLWTAGANSDIYYNGTGQVGIGITSPIVPLHIQSDNTSLRLQKSTTTGSLALDFYEGSTRKGLLWLESNDDFNLRSEDGDLIFQTNGNQNRMSILNNGNVGVGTSNPTSKFEINGDMELSDGSGKISFMNSNTEEAYIDYLTSTDMLRFFNTHPTGGILMNTFTFAGFNTDNYRRITIDDDGDIDIGVSPSDPSITIEEANFATAATRHGIIRLWNNNMTSSSEAILIDTDGSANEPFIRMNRNDGSLGIMLDVDVAGDARITTDELEIKGGSDFAEHFDILEEDVVPQPGMVVSIDPKSSGKLKIATTAYDKRVAGIISGANGVETGVMMGQEGSIADGDYPIALSGRVYVYANTENGDIMPGDLLTSSSTEGQAMKVSDFSKAQGSIIGKAMTEIDKNGFVLVLVNLQ